MIEQRSDYGGEMIEQRSDYGGEMIEQRSDYVTGCSTLKWLRSFLQDPHRYLF